MVDFDFVRSFFSLILPLLRRWDWTSIFAYLPEKNRFLWFYLNKVCVHATETCLGSVSAEIFLRAYRFYFACISLLAQTCSGSCAAVSAYTVRIALHFWNKWKLRESERFSCRKSRVILRAKTPTTPSFFQRTASSKINHAIHNVNY